MILTEFHIVKLENPKKRLHHMPFDCLLSTSFYSLFFVKNSITMEGVWRSQSKNPISHVIFPKINPPPPPPSTFHPLKKPNFLHIFFMICCLMEVIFVWTQNLTPPKKPSYTNRIALIHIDGSLFSNIFSLAYGGFDLILTWSQLYLSQHLEIHKYKWIVWPAT